MERNVRLYDLSDPFQAFQFAVFLCRLRRHNEELRGRAAGQAWAILDELRAGKVYQWKMPTP